MAQESSITISLLTDNPTTWGVEVQAYGSVTGSEEGDSVTVSWGDGTAADEGIAIEDGTWGLGIHTYDQSAVGTHEITAQLINSEGEEVASSSLSIEIQKHSTVISFDEIDDVIQGQNVTVTGVFTDGNLGTPIPEIELEFAGSGGENLPPAQTDENGFFNSTGPSPNIAEDGLVVLVTLANSEIYSDPVDSIVTYNTISTTAESYDVLDGEDVIVELSNFSASVEFEHVVTAGTLLAYDCDAPTSPRYLDPSSIGLCLNIRPSIEIAEGSTALVTISTAGVVLPSDTDFTDLHMFHVVNGDSVADITLRSDEENEKITGQTFSFSRFVIAVPDFPPPADHSRRLPVVLGDNVIDFRNVESQANASAVIEIDDSRLSSDESATLTITDSDGNINPDASDSVTAFVSSDTSTPDGIFLELQETDEDTGVFEGTFSITSGSSSGTRLEADPGDNIYVNYTQSAGRLRAVIEGVSEGGIAEMIDYTIDPTEVNFIPIGGAVELQLVGAQLGPDGKITVTMSYANAVTRGQLPPSYRLFHLEEGIWNDITLRDGDDVIGVDNVTKTVTGETTSLSPFSIGVFTGVPGGAGGGGFTGRGVVVDAVASIVRSSGGGGGGGGGGGSGGAPASSSVTQVRSGNDVSVAAELPVSSGRLGGTVTLNFDNVLAAGNIQINELSLSSTPTTLFTAVDSNHGTMTSTDGANFKTVGPIFDIKPGQALTFEGAVDVTIPYSEDLTRSVAASDSALEAEPNIRFMHFNVNGWEDVTKEIDSVANTVTGRISSFSQVVAAVVDDGTFSASYFEINPLRNVVFVAEDAQEGSNAGDSIVSVMDSTGAKVASVPPKSKVTIASSFKNMQRVSQPYTYIVEILAPNGVAIDIQTLTGTVEKGQVVKLQTDWTASPRQGNYTVKIFVIDDISEKGTLFLLTGVAESTITVVS